MKYAKAIGKGVRSGLDAMPLNFLAGLFVGGGMMAPKAITVALGCALLVYVLLRDTRMN